MAIIDFVYGSAWFGVLCFVVSLLLLGISQTKGIPFRVACRMFHAGMIISLLIVPSFLTSLTLFLIFK